MPEQPTRARFKVLLLIFLVAAITYADRLLISAAAPAITRDFGLTPSRMGMIFSAFALAYALFEIPSGWWGDRIGTRKALTRIALCWSAFTILTGASAGFRSLLGIRFLFGAAEAGAFPMIARTVSRWFPASEQGRAMSAAFLGLALGASVTAPLALPLIAAQGWRVVFVWFGLLGSLWCVAWYWWFRDTPEEHAGVSVVGAGPPARPPSVPWGRLLASGNLLCICGMYFAYGYGLYFYVTWLPTYLLRARGFSAANAGWLAGLPWLVSAAGFVLGGWLTDRIAARTSNLRLARCAVGATGYAASAAALVAVALTADRWVAAGLLAVAAFFQMATAPAAWSVCLDVGREHAGVVTGFMNTVGNLGGALAPTVIGYVVELRGSWEVSFFVSAAVFALGILFWMLVNPRRPLLLE
jgi:predicted MFS family arabinose efflux permease